MVLNTKDLLERLCAMSARSGHEAGAAREICRLFADYCGETYVTPMGSARWASAAAGAKTRRL